MSKIRIWPVGILAFLVWSYYARPIFDWSYIALGRGRDKIVTRVSPAVGIPYDDVIGLNTKLVTEMEDYLEKYRQSSANSPLLAKVDYSTVEKYAETVEPLRDALKRSLNYPPSNAIQGTDFSAVREVKLSEDSLATYSLLTIPSVGTVETGVVNAVGVLIVPKIHSSPMPIIIAAHGRGGPPASAADGTVTILQRNNRDLARGAVERGWAVFEPTFLFYGTDYPENIRDILTLRAQEAGTSLVAIEFTKTIRSIDYLLSRPEFDSTRLAMVGMSYGGFNTLYTAALDSRIRVAVVAAYFNERSSVLRNSEPTGFLDWRFSGSTSLFSDPQIAALICPRPLQIQFGTQDQLFPLQGARDSMPAAKNYYRKLGVDDQFQYHEFVGRHDFDGAAAWTFIERMFAGNQ